MNVTLINDINNLEITCEVGGGIFECNNGFETKLNNIKSGYPYYFFINIFKYENSSFILTMESTNSNPFDYLFLYEYDRFNKMLNHSIYPFETKIENNKLVSYFSFFAYDSKKIVFNIIPKFNVNYVNVEIVNGGGYYSLSSSLKYFNNLISGKSYYFSIKASNAFDNSQTINILLIMNYVDDNQFNLIHIYEYSTNNIFSAYNKYKNDRVPNIKIENNNEKELVFIYSYKIDFYKTNYVIFKIIPNSNIKRMEINYNFSSDNKETTSFTLGISYFFISLPLFVIIILTVFFIRKDDILKSHRKYT